MKRVMPLTSINKAGRFKIYELIAKHILRVLSKVNLTGKNIDQTLFNIVTNAPKLSRTDRIKLGRLCCLLGADIDSINFFNGSEWAGETLLTVAIERHSFEDVEDLLKMGANPIYPNIKGEVPIEFAYAESQYGIGLLLKDNGGDPARIFIREDRYDMISRKGYYYYGKDYGKDYLAQKIKEKEKLKQERSQQVNIPGLPIFTFTNTDNTSSSRSIETQTIPTEEVVSHDSPFNFRVLRNSLLIFSAGTIAGSLCAWLYNKWKNKKQRLQELEDEKLAPQFSFDFMQ
jgi:hypothetical protein